MICCFIGHRKIDQTDELKNRLRSVICALIALGVTTFLFGDHSAFNTLCYEMVTELKEEYPKIQRIHLRTNYPDADDYTKQFLMSGYEDCICPEGVATAGKAAYIVRNQAMIRASDFCVFYYSGGDCPERRKASNRTLTSHQPRNGTKVALDYARAKDKVVINLYSGEPLI